MVYVIEERHEIIMVIERNDWIRYNGCLMECMKDVYKEYDMSYNSKKMPTVI